MPIMYIALIEIDFCLINRIKQVNNIKILSNGKSKSLFKVQTKKIQDKKGAIFNFTWIYCIMIKLK